MPPGAGHDSQSTRIDDVTVSDPGSDIEERQPLRRRPRWKHFPPINPHVAQIASSLGFFMFQRGPTSEYAC